MPAVGRGEAPGSRGGLGMACPLPQGPGQTELSRLQWQCQPLSRHKYFISLSKLHWLHKFLFGFGASLPYKFAG
jgi:hypothetical protein